MVAELLPPEQEPMLEFLSAAGYSRDLIKTNYPLPISGPLSQLTLVAFSRPAPLDMTTAAVAGEDVSQGEQLAPLALDGARSLAAPLALMQRQRQIQLWKIGPSAGQDQLLGEGENPSELAGRFAGISSPSALMAAKEGRQLTLFPLDASLLSFARAGSSSYLSRLITEAMAAAIGERKDLGVSEWQAATKLVVQALAALVVRDKFQLPGTGTGVLDAAASKFPGFFAQQRQLSQSAMDAAARVIDILGCGINYRGVDSAVISRVYEDTVVSTAARARQGIYYTPPELAYRIASALPFEEIEPEGRVVLDPACGSGTLLLAAHDRLAGLLPLDSAANDKQGYLRAHLIGYDSDPFATEIARLSLLLHSLPFGNHWRVETRDSLSDGHISPDSPSIVLSNPPWQGRRSVEGQRSEEAIRFLRKMLDLARPGGFIAAILPASWLDSDVARSSRAALQEHAQIFEVWRLPEGTFESAALAPCVVFARNVASSPRPWVYRRVRPGSVYSFYATGAAEDQFLSSGFEGVVPNVMLRGPFDPIRDQLSTLPQLSSIATVESSPVPQPGRAPSPEGRFVTLRKAGDFPAYGNPSTDELTPVDYPDDFHRAGRNRGFDFRRAKILVSSRRSPANPWRLKAGVDHFGVIPRESMHMVIPADGDEDRLYALLALLGSRLASAWIDAYEPKRSIGIGLLRQMPVPNPGAPWMRLAQAGRSLHAAQSPEEISSLARDADHLIEQMVDLPKAVSRDFDRIFAGRRAPEGRERYGYAVEHRQDDALDQDVYGAVLADEPPLLRIWVPGVTPENGTWIGLPPNLPGWLCTTGATFDVNIGADLLTAKYRVQSRAYQDPDADQVAFAGIPE